MKGEIDPDKLRRLERRQPLANAVIVIMSLLLLFPLTVVALRMYVRIRIAKKVRMDDFFVILATIFSIGVTIAIAYENKLGVLSRAGIKAGLALHLLHFTSAWALKMSVLIFCHNTFGRVISRRKNFLIWACMGMVTSIWIISFGTSIFSCSPISDLWNSSTLIKGADGCINILAEQFALAIINAISDSLIMYLPLVLIRYSDLNSTEKKYISGIFSLAFLAVLASIGRVVSYAIVVGGFKSKAAMIWILLPISTSFELNCAIAASSLPSLSPLFRSAAQKFRWGGGRGDMDVDVEPDLMKPVFFYEQGEKFDEEQEWGWKSDSLVYGDGKTGSGGILVETSYQVERSSPRFPVKAVFSPRRWTAHRWSGGAAAGGGNAPKDDGRNVMRAQPSLKAVEAREPVKMERGRLSILEVLRQGPPLPSSEQKRGKGGKVLGV